MTTERRMRAAGRSFLGAEVFADLASALFIFFIIGGVLLCVNAQELPIEIPILQTLSSIAIVAAGVMLVLLGIFGALFSRSLRILVEIQRNQLRQAIRTAATAESPLIPVSPPNAQATRPATSPGLDAAKSWWSTQTPIVRFAVIVGPILLFAVIALFAR